MTLPHRGRVPQFNASSSGHVPRRGATDRFRPGALFAAGPSGERASQLATLASYVPLLRRVLVRKGPAPVTRNGQQQHVCAPTSPCGPSGSCLSRLQQRPATSSDIVVGTYHLSHQQIMRDPFLSPRNQDDKQSQKTTKMYPYIRIKSTLGPVGRRREQRNKSGHDIPSDRFRPSRGDHGTMTAERPVLAPVSLFPHTDTRAFPHK